MPDVDTIVDNIYNSGEPNTSPCGITETILIAIEEEEHVQCSTPHQETPEQCNDNIRQSKTDFNDIAYLLEESDSHTNARIQSIMVNNDKTKKKIARMLEMDRNHGQSKTPTNK